MKFSFMLNEAFNQPYEITLVKRMANFLYRFQTDKGGEYQIGFMIPKGIGKTARRITFSQRVSGNTYRPLKKIDEPMRFIATLMKALETFSLTPTGKKTLAFAIEFPLATPGKALSFTKRLISRKLKSRFYITESDWAPDPKRKYVFVMKNGVNPEDVFITPEDVSFSQMPTFEKKKTMPAPIVQHEPAPTPVEPTPEPAITPAQDIEGDEGVDKPEQELPKPIRGRLAPVDIQKINNKIASMLGQGMKSTVKLPSGQDMPLDVDFAEFRKNMNEAILDASKNQASKKKYAKAYSARMQKKIMDQKGVFKDLASTIVKKSNFSKKEMDAITVYCGSGYDDINKYLLGIPPGSRVSRRRIEKNLPLLDSAMKNQGFSIPDSTTVFRGMKNAPWDIIDDLYRGKQFKTSGFMSTSLIPYVAISFGSSDATLDSLIVPKASAKYPIDHPNFADITFIISGLGGTNVIIPGDLSPTSGEAEVLIDRGTRFVMNPKNPNAFKLTKAKRRVESYHAVIDIVPVEYARSIKEGVEQSTSNIASNQVLSIAMMDQAELIDKEAKEMANPSGMLSQTLVLDPVDDFKFSI